jgi:hypothetical protein
MLAFPTSVQRIEKPDFNDVFLDELQQQESSLRLQEYCTDGGWPDDDSIVLRVHSVAVNPSQVVVKVEQQIRRNGGTANPDIHRFQRRNASTGSYRLMLTLYLEP